IDLYSPAHHARIGSDMAPPKTMADHNHRVRPRFIVVLRSEKSSEEWLDTERLKVIARRFITPGADVLPRLNTHVDGHEPVSHKAREDGIPIAKVKIVWERHVGQAAPIQRI